MEKKLILEEISRISEIMNIKNKLHLFEGSGLGNEVVKFIEDGAVKDVTKSVDEVVNMLEKSTISNPVLVANAFRDLISKDAISEAEREFAANVFRTIFPTIISKSVNDFINAPKRSPLARQKFINYFLNDTKTLSEKAAKLIKLGYGNATELTAKIWEDELKKTTPKIDIPDVNPTPSVLSDEQLLESFLNSTDEEVIQQVEANLEDTILKLVSEKKINLGGVNSSDVAEEISKSIDYTGKADIAQIKRVFDKLTPSQQINKANQAIEALQAALDKKGKNGASRWIGQKWKTIDKSNPTKFVATFIKFYKWCMIIMAIYGVYDLFYDKSIDWADWKGVIKGKLLGILKGPYGIIETIIGGDDNPTPGGQYTDTLDSFKQFLRDKNNQNADSATYNSNTGIYYINGVDYEFDSATKTFK